MKRTKAASGRIPMRPEYDFEGGVRGKYAERFARGGKVVELDPDVADRFKTSASVNQALRFLLEVEERAGSRYKEIVRRKRIRELKQLFGKVYLDLDLGKSRRRPGRASTRTS